MRELTDHMVNSSNEELKVRVLDEPGSGGACHHYEIQTPPREGCSAGCEIKFQNGPIKEVGVNGVTHESLIAVCIDRLRSFQAGQYACRENALALTHLETALMWLHKRTRDRIARSVEGTHTK